MHEDMQGPTGLIGYTVKSGEICYPGAQGPIGDKGIPGPYCAETELELVAHLIASLEQAEYYGRKAVGADGENPRTEVDSFVVSQAKDALKNYEALLGQRLYELVAPGFFNIKRPAKTCESVR